VKPRHKFRAQPTAHGGVRYASKLEARHAARLDLLKDGGAVLGWLRQIPFHFPDGTVYRCDFQVFWADGRVTFEECKGVETPEWKIKARLLAHHFPWVELTMIRK
jgi:hypothetical protein